MVLPQMQAEGKQRTPTRPNTSHWNVDDDDPDDEPSLGRLMRWIRRWPARSAAIVRTTKVWLTGIPAFSSLQKSDVRCAREREEERDQEDKNEHHDGDGYRGCDDEPSLGSLDGRMSQLRGAQQDRQVWFPNKDVEADSSEESVGCGL